MYDTTVMRAAAERAIELYEGFEHQHVAARAGYAEIERLYNAIGDGDRLARDEFEGGHQFSGAVAYDWFKRWL